MNTLTALGTYVLIKPSDVNPKTEGGLFMPPTASSTSQQEGVVVSFGSFVELPIQVGDKVVFAKHGALEQKTPEGVMYIVSENSLLAVWT